jgi:hypothetical protein
LTLNALIENLLGSGGGGKSTQMIYLDRILVNQAWITIFPHSYTYSFPHTMSDHSPPPICLNNDIFDIFHTPSFKFEVYWLNQEGFSELMVKWWNSFPHEPLTSQIWKLKLEQLRLKIKGWSVNIKRVLKDKKSKLTYSITKFEMLLEHRDMYNDEYDAFFYVKNELSNVYRDEVVYWLQRARLQWLHQGDVNTIFLILLLLLTNGQI